MDSVGIGEVRQCDDEWRTEFTVRGMKCAFLAAKYVTAVTATKRQKDEADQRNFFRIAKMLATQTKSNETGGTNVTLLQH